MSQQPRFLITGAGVAGLVIAHFLAKYLPNAYIVIAERAPKMRENGQGVDIRSLGIDVLRHMGIEQGVRDASTHEEGMVFIDDADRDNAVFPEDGALSFTSEIEIQRGDLTHQLLSKVPKSVEFRFDTHVIDFAEDHKGVTVTFASGATETFDMHIAADGLGSATRRMLEQRGEVKGTWHDADGTTKSIHDLHTIIALFTIPKTARDTNFARIWNGKGGRMAMTRPASRTRTGVYLGITDPAREAELAGIAHKPDELAKQAVHAEFASQPFARLPELLSGLESSEDAYVQRIAQVYVDRWRSRGGRVALVGDAAACPSPFTGLGTTVAIYGAYVLACSVAREVADAASAQRSPDYAAAAAAYEVEARPFVKQCQTLAPSLPDILAPRTGWGLSMFRWIVWLGGIFYSTLGRWLMSLVLIRSRVDGMVLPPEPGQKEA